MNSILLRVCVTWLLFLPVPILNGWLREKWYKAIIGESLSHQLGAVLISAVFLLYAYVCLKGTVASLPNWQLWCIGLLWLVLTLVFEFGLGLAAGRSWSYILSDYEVWHGRIWPLVLVTVLLSPFIVKWIVKH